MALDACGTPAPAPADPYQSVRAASQALSVERSYRMDVSGAALVRAGATASFQYVSPNSLAIDEGLIAAETHIRIIGSAMYASLPRDLLRTVEGTDTSRADHLAGQWVGPLTAPELRLLPGVAAWMNQPARIGPCVLETHGTLTNQGTATWQGQAVDVIEDHGDQPGTAPGQILISRSTSLPLARVTSGSTRPGGSSTECALLARGRHDR